MNVRTSLLLTVLFLLSSVWTRCAEGLPGDTILIGTVYNIFHEEYATDEAFFRQVDRDIPAIAAAHFDYLMIFPMSEWDPATRTHRWVRTDYLVKKIEACHLKFVPLLLKEEQCSYYFPIWKFQELGLWNERDVNNGNPNNRENVDFDDPRILPLVKDYIREVAARYGSSPALGFYNLWNEPHYSSTAPHVVARFREWLKKKYGTLAALRRAWGDDYTDWSQVSPFLNDDWNSSMPGIDWTIFRQELQGELLEELRQVLRTVDPTHAVNANPVGTPFANFVPFAGYNTDNWQFTEHNDFNGVSYYPDAWTREHNLLRTPQWFHNFSFDVFRSAAGPKDYILTEVYTNAKTGLTLGGYLDPDTARLLAWTALANNCKGLIYWKWEPFHRGRQSLGRGLVGLDGTLAPRGEAVRDFAAIVKTHGPLLRQARLLPARVGVVVDLVGLLKTLQQPAEPKTQTFMYRDIAGIFRALDEANLSADLLRADRGLSAAELANYKVLILPFQIVMRRDLATLLKTYVQNGGCLIADARTATIDEFDFAYSDNPGAGLIDLFGASRKDWRAENQRYPVQIDAPGLWSGTFAGVDFRDQLRLAEGATVLGTFVDTKDPALVSHRSGKGTTYLAAIPLGVGADEQKSGAASELLVKLCEWAGAIEPASYTPRDKAGEKPMLRVHCLGNERILYVINSSDQPIAGEASLTLEAGLASARSENLLNDASVPSSIVGNRIIFPLSLEQHGVMVIHVHP